eukprot:gb/GECG01005284.1/.p1 GENE.gb/GECG01005284.1/~~gb/GECG01005284.1/.p1  ORF type:complete len:135 (+),score=21.02 gb/GECG01005284.1/:1-405(+)
MRLMTHNMLYCNVKACVETANLEAERPRNFPLKINPVPGGIKHIKQEFNEEFIKGLFHKLDWEALKQTASELEIAQLPESPPENYAEDTAFLRSVHELIMEIHIMEGALECRHCGRTYPITKGIPNMLLDEDEV